MSKPRGHQLFHDYGGWILALSRWLPLLPEVVACMAGLFHMSARPVALALFSRECTHGTHICLGGAFGRRKPDPLPSDQRLGSPSSGG